jgi:hypothetical protein
MHFELHSPKKIHANQVSMQSFSAHGSQTTIPFYGGVVSPCTVDTIFPRGNEHRFPGPPSVIDTTTSTSRSPGRGSWLNARRSKRAQNESPEQWRSDMNLADVKRWCGRVARLPRRLSPLHGLRPSCRNIQPVANYLISFRPCIFSSVYSCTHYFPPFMLPDSLHSCVSVFDLILLSGRYNSDVKINYSTMQESSIIELSDFSPYHLLISPLHHRLFIYSHYVLPTRCARPESSAFSDYTGD